MLVNSFDTYPPIPQKNLIVDLNANTMLTTGDVMAASGQPITNWKNYIKGNGVIGASQYNASYQPILQVAGDGSKEIKFDGINDFLNLLKPAELDFQKTDSFTTVVFTGNQITQGYLICKGIQATKQYATWYGANYMNLEAFSNSDTWVDQIPLPSTPQIIVSRYNNVEQTLDLYINGVFQTSSQTPNTLLYPLNDTLIGARHGSTDNNSYFYFYGGSLRRVLIWNRALSQTEIEMLSNHLIN